MENNQRKRPPPVDKLFPCKRYSTTPFCRITGKSHSMDEHHYVPSSDDFPKFDNLSGCRITEKHHTFKDYKYAYPILDPDGTTRMVTEQDFHCRITAKYKAMEGYSYIYPVLGATTDKSASDMTSVSKDAAMQDVIIPSEVDLIVEGGVQDVLRQNDDDDLFIYTKQGSIIPAAVKEIRCERTKQGRRHTLPVGLEGSATRDLKEFKISLSIKLLSEIKRASLVDDNPSSVEVFDQIAGDVEVLKDIRKSRPKRPNRPTKGEVTKKRMRNGVEVDASNTAKEDKGVMYTVEENVSVSPPKTGRLEKYKLQFSTFRCHEDKDSGNRLVLVGAYDRDEVMILDFSETTEPDEHQSSTSTHGFSKSIATSATTRNSSSAAVSMIAEESETCNTINKGMARVKANSIDETFGDKVECTVAKNTLDSSKQILQGSKLANLEPNASDHFDKVIEADQTVQLDRDTRTDASERIVPKKIHNVPRSGAEANLMNELKTKLGRGVGKKEQCEEDEINQVTVVSKTENPLDQCTESVVVSGIDNGPGMRQVSPTLKKPKSVKFGGVDVADNANLQVNINENLNYSKSEKSNIEQGIIPLKSESQDNTISPSLNKMTCSEADNDLGGSVVKDSNIDNDVSIVESYEC